MSQKEKSISEIMKECEAYDNNGALEFHHIPSGEVIRIVDFDISKELPKTTEDLKEDNQNLTKTEQKNIKNKKKSDVIIANKDKKTEDLKTDTKKIIDGEEKETEAEGDDDEVEEKIKGDPYNEDEKLSKKKKDLIEAEKKEVDIKKEVQDLLKTYLEPLQKDLSEYKKDKAAKEAIELKELQTVLQKEPYRIPLETMKDMTLSTLKSQKEAYDKLPIIQDFFKQPAELTYDQIKRNAIDMTPLMNDTRDFVLKAAQEKFKIDLGDRYKKDFGGAN